MKENISLEKLRNRLVAFYKLRLRFVQILFLLAICFCGYFLFSDFSEKPIVNEKNSVNDVTDDNVGIIDEEIPTEKKESLTQSVDNSADAMDKIAKIIKNTAKEFHDGQGESDELKQKDAVKSESDSGKKEELTNLLGDKLYISIIIDDMGINQELTKEIIGIKAPITTSFLTYGNNLDDLVEMAKSADHEVILHIPMEPYSATNTAPGQLELSMSNREIKNSLNSFLDRIKGIRGGNNHMGSKFTENKAKMAVVMKVLQKRKMFFLDSKTSSKAIGCEVAAEYGVNCANRDVFLDNENDFDYIMGQLHQVEKIARKKGYAIAIGHPKSQTVAALNAWVKTLDKDQFEILHLGNLIKKINKKS